MKFGWTDIDEIAIQLADARPDVDPVDVSFPQLRAMVEQLDGFQADPQHRVNEQILEAIQAAWIEEREDAAAGGHAGNADEDASGGGGGENAEDETSGGSGGDYAPVNPFR